jgi:hypothetical protein
LVARGVDPITAVTLAMQNAAEMAAYNTPVVGSAMQGAAPQGAAAQFAPQGISPAAIAQMVSGAADMYGKPISGVTTTPIGGNQIESSYDFGGGNVADNSGISYDMSDFGFR